MLRRGRGREPGGAERPNPLELARRDPLGGGFAGSCFALLATVCGWAVYGSRPDEVRPAAYLLTFLPAGALIAGLRTIDQLDPAGAAIAHLVAPAALAAAGAAIWRASPRLAVDQAGQSAADPGKSDPEEEAPVHSDQVHPPRE